ncbi:MAG: hypothetical protein NTZ24_01835 [Deltaproteobacteria bacterium]|nr:hypothetical protein [Deltaproteobacteria bacterium]
MAKPPLRGAVLMVRLNDFIIYLNKWLKMQILSRETIPLGGERCMAMVLPTLPVLGSVFAKGFRDAFVTGENR